MAVEAYHTLADALRGLGRFDQSLALYDSMMVIFTQPRERTEILYRIGLLHLDDLNEPALALKYFDSIIANFQLGFGLVMARMKVPYCYLQQGDVERSRQLFQQLQQQATNPEQAEEISYHLAMIEFYEKRNDSAKVALRRLINDYPRGFYVNDALQLLSLFTKANDAPELLYDFSNALLFRQMHQTDSSAAKLMSLVTAENQALADVALYELAKASLVTGDSTVATIYIERLEAEHPDSYYLPYALKLKADMLVTTAATRNEAVQLYRTLLQNFSNYPFISEVRKLLRQYDEDSQIG
jgi:tetratricopeptide (TPR) repeat protein